MPTYSVDVSVTKNHHHIMKIIFLILAVATLCRTNAEIREDTKVRALFIGNSYTKGMPDHVQKLAEAQGLILDVVSINPGGAQIGKTHSKKKSSASKSIKKGGWDVVILQEQSQIPAMGEKTMCYYNTIKGAQKLVNLIHKFNPNAKVQWFMTWGSHSGSWLKTFEGLF